MDSKYFKMFGINYLVIVENSSGTVKVEFSFVNLDSRRQKFDELHRQLQDSTEKFTLSFSDCDICFNHPRLGVDSRLTPITSEELEKEFIDFVYSE